MSTESKTPSKEKFFPASFTELFKPWDEWFNGGKSLFSSGWPSISIPAANISENKDGYQVSLAAPGLKKDEFSIDVDDDMLTISAEQKQTKEEKNERFSRKEYNYSSFSRSFALPAGVAADKISAHYTDGILSITLPKKDTNHQSSSKKVPVK